MDKNYNIDYKHSPLWTFKGFVGENEIYRDEAGKAYKQRLYANKKTGEIVTFKDYNVTIPTYQMGCPASLSGRKGGFKKEIERICEDIFAGKNLEQVNVRANRFAHHEENLFKKFMIEKKKGNKEVEDVNIENLFKTLFSQAINEFADLKNIVPKIVASKLAETNHFGESPLYDEVLQSEFGINNNLASDENNIEKE